MSISIVTSKGIKTQGYPDFYSGYPKNKLIKIDEDLRVHFKKIC